MRFPAALLACCCAVSHLCAEPLLLAHYLNDYATKPVSGAWSTGWTLDHFDPDRQTWDDQRRIASHDYPLIGPYDSGDEHLMEYHVLLMKLAGLDGVVVRWRGLSTDPESARVHRNTQKLVPWLGKAGLRFAIQYGPAPVDAERSRRDEAGDLRWAEEHFFASPQYVGETGRPVLLVDQPPGAATIAALKPRPLLFGPPHLVGSSGIDGATGWPPLRTGSSLSPEEWKEALAPLYNGAHPFIATAFPGYKDVYQQAGQGQRMASIDARHGLTFTESLTQARDSRASITDIATWNSYTEGTMIEPSRSRGYRYLEALPRCRMPEHLHLPAALYHLRKRGGDSARLEEASRLLFASRGSEAQAILDDVSRTLGKHIIDGGYHLTTDILYRDEASASAAQKQRCRLDVYTPASGTSFPTVIWFHGGGLTQGERFIPLPLRQQGIGVIAANYRLSPDVAAPAFIEDAAAAIAWTYHHIAEFGGDAQRLYVSGHSAGAYLTLMCGLEPKWLAAHGIKTGDLAGLIPLSPQVITHFTIRAERGIADTQPIIDPLAPLFHVRSDAPPILLVTGDREKELMGRYEECAYFWRMMKLAGHRQTSLLEMDGYDHGSMPEPAFPLLLKFVREKR